MTFGGGADDTDNFWTNPAYWTPTTPGSGDDAVVDATLFGVVIVDGDDVTVRSLELNGGINIHIGGQLTVTDQIINNGIERAYGINAGVMHVGSGGTVGTIINTYDDRGDDDPENDFAGYWQNSGQVTGLLDNSGAAINGGDEFDHTNVLWIGDVENHATGFVSNSGGRWEGDVTNRGGIFNGERSTWVGNVVNDDGYIENMGLWQGDLLSNAGVIFSVGVWEGDLTSSGDMLLTGEVRGNITNTGTVHVRGALSGVQGVVNNGHVDLVDGQANGRVTAQSWSGNGSVAFDVSARHSDEIVLTGDYSGDTLIELAFNNQGRALGEITLVTVGGAKTGTVDVTGLPDNAVVSYRLIETADGWSLTSELSDAPVHVATALALVNRSTAALMTPPGDGACAEGNWARPLGGATGGELAGEHWRVDTGGIEIGGRVGCTYDADGGWAVETGFAAGIVGGKVSHDTLAGLFGQGFAGLYAHLDAGALSATLQGRVTGSTLQLRDAAEGLSASSLQSMGYDISGSTAYDVEIGAVTLTPMTGFVVAGAVSRSSEFGDVGGASLSSAPSLAGHVGLRAAGRVPAGPAGPVLAPFASAALHGELIAPTASFAPDAGGVATLDLPGQGAYLSLGAGVDLLGTPEGLGGPVAGIRADLDFGPQVRRSAFAGHARVSF